MTLVNFRVYQTHASTNCLHLFLSLLAGLQHCYHMYSSLSSWCYFYLQHELSKCHSRIFFCKMNILFIHIQGVSVLFSHSGLSERNQSGKSIMFHSAYLLTIWSWNSQSCQCNDVQFQSTLLPTEKDFSCLFVCLSVFLFCQVTNVD